jgi:hypothetical protein
MATKERGVLIHLPKKASTAALKLCKGESSSFKYELESFINTGKMSTVLRKALIVYRNELAEKKD